MKILNLKDLGGSLKRCSAILCIGLIGLALSAYGQSLQRAGAPKPDGISSVNYIANGTGIMVGGELWDSYMPANRGPYYGEAAGQLVQDAIRIGNFDRQWSTPTHMWPGGYDHGNFWNKDIEIATFDPDPTYNPATIGGAANPSYVGADGPNYALAAYANKPTLSPKRVVLGAGDPTRDYYQETQWVDSKRHHAVYKAGWPTTAGIDVKMQVDQYSLHWNNFNDFIIVKITLTNTGMVDMDANGVAEKTNHRVAAVALLTHGENMCSFQLNTGAGRINRFGAQRVQAYIGDADPKGNPWDLAVGFPGESATGVHDMGLNDFPNRFYTEIWSGFTWLGAKDATTGQDKKTIFGSPSIGIGPERGYYTASGMGRGLSFGINQPKGTFVTATGEWYVDGGKSRNSAALDLHPNPNYFASGTVGDVTTFVPKAAPTRPNGDRKLLSLENGAAAFEVNPYEPTLWTKGYAGPSNFDGDFYKGIGPFSLNVGESITITYVEVGGYRLSGILNAVAAARYVYDNGDAVLDSYPSVPDMRLDFIAPGTPVVRWDNRAESDPNFAGYKLYRASQAIPLDYTLTGMRVMDNYWKNMTPGPTPDNLKQPINPSFTAFDFVHNKIGAPDSWGPYDLVTVIPKSSLSQYANSTTSGYNYAYVDAQAPIGLKFWYYISAYTSAPVTLNSSYSGLNSATTPFLETSNLNRNGASGLWVGTYPFAFLNSDYPKTAQGLKDLGPGVSVDHYPAAVSDLLSGALKVSVKPNPYKKRAMFDNITDASDHKVLFYNLPPQAKITILDVSGQIIQILNFNSTGPSNGTMYWNLFSKTGIEVASGLYIYVVEYAGGQQVGYLSVMR
jgi:hypothetical protein